MPDCQQLTHRCANCLQALKNPAANAEVYDGINGDFAQRLHKSAVLAVEIFLGKTVAVTIQFGRTPELYAGLEHEADALLGDSTAETESDVGLERGCLYLRFDVSILVRRKQIVAQFVTDFISRIGPVIVSQILKYAVFLIISLDYGRRAEVSACRDVERTAFEREHVEQQLSVGEAHLGLNFQRFRYSITCYAAAVAYVKISAELDVWHERHTCTNLHIVADRRRNVEAYTGSSNVDTCRKVVEHVLSSSCALTVNAPQSIVNDNTRCLNVMI